MDIEARARDDHHDSLRVWLRMLTCTQLIENRVRRFLRSDFATTLPRFDLLAQLERQPKDKGQRMSDLSKRLMVTGGNVTGITDQLVDEGLVARVIDPADRRSFLIELTPAGRKAFAEMAREHEELIRELFGGLKGSERAALHELLGQLKQSLTGAGAFDKPGGKPSSKPGRGGDLGKSKTPRPAVSTKPARPARERKHGIR